MTLKVKIREDNKAMIKFDSAIHSAQEKQWFVNLMRSIRDSDPGTHPPISIKDKGGDIPRLPPPKRVSQGKEGKPIPPELLEKMEKVKVEKKTNEMKK